MAIPKQVRQRSEQVDDMYRERAQPAEQPNADQSDDDAQQNENSQQAEEHDAQQAAADDQVTQNTDDGDEFQIDRPDDVAKQLADMQKQIEQSDQRFRTLQGMQQRTEQENQRLNMLLSQMAVHEREEKPAENQPAAAADPGESKDRADFGDDFIDMVNRAIERRLSKLESRLGKTEDKAEKSYKSSQKSAQERFDAQLDKLVPNWRAIDTSAEFMQWLNASKTRLAIVREGMADYDATAIAEIFELYIKLTGTGQEAPATEPAGKKLEKRLAPSKGRASTPSGSEQKKIWTKSEIAQVFRDRRRYDPKEFEKLQKDIFNAQNEERVDYTR